MSPKEQELFYTFASALQARSEQLADLGLRLQGELEAEETTLSVKKGFVYVRQNNDYLFDVRLSLLRTKPVAVLHAYITHADGRNLSLADYARTHSTDLQEREFTIPAESGTFASDLERLLYGIFNLLQGELRPVLSGERWENVPIDWQGYK